jgi:hypothetical protein
MQPTLLWFCCLAAIAAMACAHGAAASDGGRQELRLGQRIFRSGIGEYKIAAQLGADGPAFEGAAMSCRGCHGPRAAGLNEGGIRSPSLLPIAGGASAGEKMIDAIERGRGPDGRALVGMPRYRMADPDRNALIAYLKALAAKQDVEPGVTEDEIRVGVGTRAVSTAKAFETIAREFERVNAKGGIYGRRLRPGRIQTAPLGSDDKALKELVERGDLFCLIAESENYSAETRVALERERLPVIEMREGSRLSPKLAARIDFTVNQRGVRRADLVAQTAADRAIVDATIDRLHALGVEARWRKDIDQFALESATLNARADAIFVFGSLEDARSIAEATSNEPTEIVMMSDEDIALEDMPPQLLRRIVPPPMEDARDDGKAQHAARIVIEALKRAGHQLDREGFALSLENLVSVDSTRIGPDGGLASPLSDSVRETTVRSATQTLDR